MQDPTTAQLISRFTDRMSAQYATTHTVVSAAGYWLLLAMLAPEADTHRAELEELLGTDAEDARRRAEELLAGAHPAVAAAAAVWARPTFTNSAFDAWARTLRHVELGPMPTQGEADAWASRNTYGMIEAFPVQLDELTAVVIATALATDVTWAAPFEAVEATLLGGEFGPLLTRALRAAPEHRQAIVDTEAAGMVGMHVGESTNGLQVLSVIAAEEVPVAAVHAAATEVASSMSSFGDAERAVDLFDLPLGDGAAWTLTEDRVLSSGGHPISDVVAYLPEWRAAAVHDLAAAPGMAAAQAALGRYLNPTGGAPTFEAKQSAVAEYILSGFKAAAITAMSMRMAGLPAAPVEVARRTATIRFNRPYAVLAVAQSSAPDLERGWGRVEGLAADAWDGVPVFSAWVAEPSRPSAG